MKMTARFVIPFALLVTCAQLPAETEVERLRARCTEQELQIQQLERKIAELTDTVPEMASASSTKKPSATSDSSHGYYSVKAGDHIPGIARLHGTTPAAINQLNDLKPDGIIHPGQKLKIPSEIASVAKTETPAAPISQRTHKIGAGETFYRISQKYGVSVDALIAANPSVNYRALRSGQTINLPATEQQTANAPVSQPTPSFGSSASLPVSNSPAPVTQLRASEKPVKITQEITYLEFAKNYLTTTKRLDELNGLDLDPSTVLAQGSELYIPAQP